MGKFQRFFISLFGSLIVIIATIFLVRLAMGKPAYISLNTISAYWYQFNGDYWLHSILDPLTEVQQTLAEFSYQIEWYEYIYKGLIFISQCVAVPFRYIYSMIKVIIDMLGFFPFVINM